MKKKYVIYTCMSGNYDMIFDPVVKHPLFDYVFFTDQKDLDSKGWSARQFSESGYPDKVLANRYHKIFPQLVLPEYELSLYIDSNMRIIGDLSSVLEEFLDSNCSIGLLKHPRRNSVSEEIDACIAYNKLPNKDMAMKQLQYYESQGFQDDQGLIEANVILRKHTDPLLNETMDLWWQNLQEFTRRDQLSLPFVLWKTQIKKKVFNWNARDENPYIYLYSHKTASKLDNFHTSLGCRKFDSAMHNMLLKMWVSVKPTFKSMMNSLGKS